MDGEKRTHSKPATAVEEPLKYPNVQPPFEFSKFWKYNAFVGSPPVVMGINPVVDATSEEYIRKLSITFFG